MKVWIEGDELYPRFKATPIADALYWGGAPVEVSDEWWDRYKAFIAQFDAMQDELETLMEANDVGHRNPDEFK